MAVERASSRPIDANWKWLLAVPIATLLNLGGMVWKTAEIKTNIDHSLVTIELRLQNLERAFEKQITNLQEEGRLARTRIEILERKVDILEDRLGNRR